MCHFRVMNFSGACTIWSDLILLSTPVHAHPLYTEHALLHAACPSSSQQAHTPWPAWVVVHLSTLLWFGPGPLPGLPPLDSPSHRPGFTAFFYLQLNSSCTNTYTLKLSYINDFMLEPLCNSGSEVVVVALVVVVLCVETLTSTDSFKGTHWWGVMAQNQLDWAGPQEVDFEVCKISVNALTWTMLSEILGYKWFGCSEHIVFL